MENKKNIFLKNLDKKITISLGEFIDLYCKVSFDISSINNNSLLGNLVEYMKLCSHFEKLAFELFSKNDDKEANK